MVRTRQSPVKSRLKAHEALHEISPKDARDSLQKSRPPENSPFQRTFCGRPRAFSRSQVAKFFNGPPLRADLRIVSQTCCNGNPVVSLDYRNYPETGYHRLPGNILSPP